MLNFTNDQYQRYIDDYLDHTKREALPVYKQMVSEVVYTSGIISVFQYRRATTRLKRKSRVANNRHFLVVPSLFNSPEILFCGRHSFITALLELGDVYLIEWQESSLPKSLECYVLALVEFVTNLNDLKVELVGHCLGGNFVLGLNCHLPGRFTSVTLLTTPWDYGHFKYLADLHSFWSFDTLVGDIEMIPKTYLQIVFFLLFQNQFSQKIHKYTSLKAADLKAKYMMIESWLHSGIDMPKSVYLEIINDLAGCNNLYRDQWRIQDQLVDLKKIHIPVCIIAAKEDQIAPLSSILPLHQGIKNSTLISVNGGHISYLLEDLNFRQQYTNWLSNINR